VCTSILNLVAALMIPMQRGSWLSMHSSPTLEIAVLSSRLYRTERILNERHTA
jgi:hypothetical protein